jgi:hypothetical protein
VFSCTEHTCVLNLTPHCLEHNPTYFEAASLTPNPQLILGSSNNSHGSHTPTACFMFDQSVSWEGKQLQHGGSCASQSGLSSPLIEPALSPPRSRLQSPLQIHLNDLAITEVAAIGCKYIIIIVIIMNIAPLHVWFTFSYEGCDCCS